MQAGRYPGLPQTLRIASPRPSTEPTTEPLRPALSFGCIRRADELPDGIGGAFPQTAIAGLDLRTCARTGEQEERLSCAERQTYPILVRRNFNSGIPKWDSPRWLAHAEAFDLRPRISSVQNDNSARRGAPMRGDATADRPNPVTGAQEARIATD